MIEDMDKEYAEQELRYFHHCLNKWRAMFKKGKIDIDGFVERCSKLATSSFWGFVMFGPKEFKEENPDVVAIYKKYVKQFHESDNEGEKCVIHDMIQYTISRMSVEEMERAKIYG